MMKVKVTHAKAPWPAGAGVGDVVEFAGALPEWAAGKCHVTDDEPTVYTVEKDSDENAIVANVVPDTVAEAEAQAEEELAGMQAHTLKPGKAKR